MKGFYLDTNIWLDYFQDRTDGLRPLGEFAFIFLKKAVELKIKIYYSDLILNELNNTIGEEKTNELINQFKSILVFVKTLDIDFIEAKNLFRTGKIHHADALHAIICKRIETILITRDKHFFELDFLEVYLPEEFIFD
jgi:predicted nucleic acid-binding protein